MLINFIIFFKHLLSSTLIFALSVSICINLEIILLFSIWLRCCSFIETSISFGVMWSLVWNYFVLLLSFCFLFSCLMFGSGPPLLALLSFFGPMHSLACNSTLLNFKSIINIMSRNFTQIQIKLTQQNQKVYEWFQLLISTVKLGIVKLFEVNI